MAERNRIDKWLWAARFFKTRSLAQAAVEGGKVQYDGQRCKASRDVQLGATIVITKGEQVFEVLVTGLSQKRGNAKAAILLYQETEESLIKREHNAAVRKALRQAQPSFDHRPNKRERRQLSQLKSHFEHD